MSTTRLMKRLCKRNFYGTLTNTSEVCLQNVTKDCPSFVQCGPCRKYEYMDMRCKVAVVTGGPCGVGFSIANELLCQEAYRVVIAHQNVENGIKAVETLEATHGENKACYVHVDYRKPQDFEDLFKLVHNKFGGTDILVNSSWPLNEYRWDHEIDANLKNVMRGTLLAFKWMPKEKKTMKGGVVINVASTSGLDSEYIAPIFTATQHGVVGLSKALGSPVHFSKNGVRVICLCPGKDALINPQELKEPELKIFNQGVTKQPSHKVGHAVSYLVRYAPSGSIWVVENSALYKTKIPNRQTFSETIDYL